MEEEVNKLQQPKKTNIENIIDTGTTQDEQVSMLLTTVNELINRANEPTVLPKLTSITKRLITGGIFSVGIIAALGWAFGSITSADALIVISSIITGGFALLRL